MRASRRKRPGRRAGCGFRRFICGGVTAAYRLVQNVVDAVPASVLRTSAGIGGHRFNADEALPRHGPRQGGDAGGTYCLARASSGLVKLIVAGAGFDQSSRPMKNNQRMTTG